MNSKHKKFLITCGPTCVAIDNMRVISNRSTGTLGQTLAKNLQKAGAKVTMLEGAVTKPLESKSIKIRKFFFFNELLDLLKKELNSKKYDFVIHAAAVSDYQPEKTSNTKISSGKKNLTLKLKPTPKIINMIKRLAPKTFLVGFKQESFKCQRRLKLSAQKLFDEAKCDLVVANSLKEGYKGYIINADKHVLAQANSRQELSAKLVQTLRNR